MEQKPENNHIRSVEQDFALPASSLPPCQQCFQEGTLPFERAPSVGKGEWSEQPASQPFRALHKESISFSPHPETGKAEMYRCDQEQRRAANISHTAGVTGYQ